MTATTASSTAPPSAPADKTLSSAKRAYAIDQPWGVVISDITVRASGDLFVI